MNRTDDILDRLRQQPLPDIANPDELTDSILDRLPDRHGDTTTSSDGRQRRRVWLYAASALSAAACMALLLVVYLGKGMSEQNISEQHVAGQNVSERVHAASCPATPDSVEAERAIVAVTAEIPRSRHNTVGIKHTVALAAEVQTSEREDTMQERNVAVVPDSFEIMTARLEIEMERIRDDCYMKRLSRTIDSDPQLRRLVDDFMNAAADTLRHAVLMKAI